MQVATQSFQSFEQLMTQVRQLSVDQRLRLIQFTAQTLTMPNRDQPSQPLPYGKFSGGRQSTPEDFVLAEWHPTERELNCE